VLRRLAERLSRLVATPEELSRLPRLLADVGVRLVYLKAFPSSKMDGCSFRMHDDSMGIGISGRGKRFDKVLFTLLHEIAHIILGHLDDADFIFDEAADRPTLGTEVDADRLASSWALPGGVPRTPDRITSAWIEDQAGLQGVHPIVLIGRLQNEGRLPWKTTLVRNAAHVTEQLEKW